MRAVLALLALILLFGCLNFQRGGNNTTVNQTINASGNASLNQTANQTNQSVNQTPPEFMRYNASGFSFGFPSDMTYQGTNNQFDGTFKAIHGTGNQTFEILIVTFVNTADKYGANRDAQYKLDSTLAASDFLESDRLDDSAGILDKADWVGNASVYSISRDAGAAEVPIQAKFGSLGTEFTGYAIDVYIPERSVLLRTRILALDQAKAYRIRQEFELSLRPE